MALGTDHYTAADVAVFTPEIWGSQVNDFYREDLKIARACTDRSDEVANGGDVLYTPNTTAFATNTKAAGAQVTLQSPTETAVTLNINVHKETSFLLEDTDKAALKRSYVLQERRMKDAGYAVAADLEDALAALFTSFSVTAGATGTDLTDVTIRTAVSKLRQAIKGSFKKQDVKFVLSPKQIWEDLMTSDRFVSFDYGQDGTKDGDAVGRIYNIDVIESTSVTDDGTDYSGALLHKDAIHFATAALPGSFINANGTPGIRMQSDYILEYLGELVVCDIKYGKVMNRADAGIEILSQVA